MIKKLWCHWLHHNNPYLKIGPFKMEVHHTDPEIAQLHDFVSQTEVDSIKDLVRGKMQSTPYFIKGSSERFSKERTSKIKYLNELIVPEAMTISKKIEQATRLKLYQDKFSSENYQVMNYGIGGKIAPHVDSFGQVFGTGLASNDLVGSLNKTGSEILKFGGLRIMTFMIYM